MGTTNLVMTDGPLLQEERKDINIAVEADKGGHFVMVILIF